MEKSNSAFIQNLNQQKKFEDKLSTIAHKITKLTNKIAKTSQKTQKQSDSSALARDLQENIEKSKQLHINPEKTFQDILYQYEEKGYYNKSNFDLDNNIFALNPLLDKKRTILQHYKSKFKNKIYNQDIELYQDKSKNYLLNLKDIINRINKKKYVIKPTYKKSLYSIISHHSSVIKEDLELKKKELKNKQRLMNENNKLIKYNIILSSKIEKEKLMQSVSKRRKTSWFDNKMHNKLLLKTNNINYQTMTNSTNPSICSTGNDINALIPNLKKQAKRIPSLIPNMNRKTLSNLNWSFSQYQTEPVPLNEGDLLKRDIIEKPKNEVIDSLYQFTQENDFKDYKNCLVQYANKYKKYMNIAHIQSFVPYLNKQFNILKSHINKYNEKEKCINWYSKIGRTNNISDQIDKLEKLDKQLTKFQYSFVKRSITIEKRD